MKVYYYEDMTTEDLANSRLKAFSSRRAAIKARQKEIADGCIDDRDDAEIHCIEFPISKQGILNAFSAGSYLALK